jgi:tetratricopeptide (TPR) repeat protein
MSTLVTLGQTLGLAGVAVGVFFLLFREVLRKNIFPMLDRGRSYKLLRMVIIIVFAFSISIATIATVAQLVLTGHLTSISFNWRNGKESLNFAISFDQYRLVTEARAASLNEVDKKVAAGGSEDLDKGFQEYNLAAKGLGDSLVKLSKMGLGSILTDQVLARVALQVQRGEVSQLNELLGNLVQSGEAKGDPDRARLIASSGYQIGRLQELTFAFDGAERAYRLTSEFDPTYFPAVSALSYLYIERGERATAREFLDAVISEIDDTRSDKALTIAQLWTVKADVFLWDGKFSEAETSLNTAATIAEKEPLASEESRSAEAERLNSTAGLMQNLGRTSDALRNIRQALDLVSQNKALRQELNIKLNLGVILVDAGELSEAVKVTQDIEPLVGKLAPKDMLRGYFYLLKAYSSIRAGEILTAKVNVKSAREFFAPAFNATDASIRIARIRCLEQRIEYFQGDDAEAVATGRECIDLTLRSGPGRIGDVVNGFYILQKIAIKQQGQRERLSATEVLRGRLPPIYVECADSMDKLLDVVVSHPEGKAGGAALDEIIVNLAALENRAGIFTDALTDAALLHDTQSLYTDKSLTVDRVNSLRRSVGARLLS